MCVKYYEGDRILLRPLELSDEELLRGWLNDPLNWKTLGRFLPVTELDERDFLQRLHKSNDQIALGIVVRDSGQLIGATGLHNINWPNRSAEFGIIIGDRGQQGLGLGGEATRLMVRYGFEELNLNRIGLSVFSDHPRAIRAYRRAGFVEEGRRRQAFFRNGKYHDELCFGLLRSEWKRGEPEDDTDCNGRVTIPLVSMTTWSTSLVR